MSPKSTPIVKRIEFLTAYTRWLHGDSQEQINTVLKNSSDHNTVDDKTILSWTNKFKDLPTEEKEKDKPFYFHNLDKYGIPWSSYEDTLGLVKRLALLMDTPPIARQAKWIWRLRQIGNMRREFDEMRTEGHPVVSIANRYVINEWETMFGLSQTETLEEISESVESEVTEIARRSYTNIQKNVP